MDYFAHLRHYKRIEFPASHFKPENKVQFSSNGVYRNSEDPSSELMNHLIAEKFNLPVPNIKNQIFLENSGKIHIERLSNKSLHKTLTMANVPEVIKKFTDLHTLFLSKQTTKLPSHIARFSGSSPIQKSIKYKNLLNSIPVYNNFCHGKIDLGTVTEHNGTLYAINLDGCYRGWPLLDISNTYIMLSCMGYYHPHIYKFAQEYKKIMLPRFRYTEAQLTKVAPLNAAIIIEHIVNPEIISFLADMIKPIF